MDFYKLLPLAILALSMAICLWLVFRPSAAQRYFADGLEKQDRPLSLSTAKRLRGVPTWAVRCWGVVALGLGILIAVAIIFFVD